MNQESLEDNMSNVSDSDVESITSDVGGVEYNEEDDDYSINEDEVENDAENEVDNEANKNIEQPLEQLDVDDDNNNEDYDDEDDDENYLMKFDKEVRKNYLVDFHPETLINNYDEIQTLIGIKRDNRGIIVDDFHKTLPFLTKYEKTRILGQRTKQINSGAKTYLDKYNLSENGKPIIDGYLIALKELEQKKIPFIIRRPLPNGGSEYWKLDDLEFIH